MARGFVNLNPLKHGRAMKRDSKEHANLQGKRRIIGKEVRFRG